jgi:hypothetical protein
MLFGVEMAARLLEVRPILIMENAALNAIRPFFDEGESAVGTAMNVQHRRPVMLNRPRGSGKSLAAQPIRMIASFLPPQASL